jgi:hypothetical protein
MSRKKAVRAGDKTENTVSEAEETEYLLPELTMQELFEALAGAVRYLGRESVPVRFLRNLFWNRVGKLSGKICFVTLPHGASPGSTPCLFWVTPLGDQFCWAICRADRSTIDWKLMAKQTGASSDPKDRNNWKAIQGFTIPAGVPDAKDLLV